MTAGKSLHVDARFFSRPTTGVERYATQLLQNMAASVILHRAPALMTTVPVGGHIWEEIALPRQLGRTDVLFSPCNFGPIAHRRQFVTIHDLGPILHPQYFGSAYRAMFKCLVPRLARRVDHVFADSEAAAADIREVFDLEPTKVSVVPLGSFLTAGVGDAVQRHERPYVLTVSSLEPRKNVAGLVAGFERFRAVHPDFRLIAVGARPPKGVFAQAGTDDVGDQVEFTGRVSDDELRRLYAGASAFATASHYEGFGLPMLDAIVARVPVACSDIPPFREMGGPSVRYFDPGDPESIGQALNEALGVDSAVSTQESVRVSAKYTWDAAAHEVARAINERYPEVEVLPPDA